MRIITAPEPFDTWKLERPLLFLAGGITGCPDWQATVCESLSDEDLSGTVFTPRRANFPMDDPNAAREQITWEFDALRNANAISFWFCKETICPIVLFELGAALERETILIIGVEPEYPREQDVHIQSQLLRTGSIVTNLVALTNDIIEFSEGFGQTPIKLSYEPKGIQELAGEGLERLRRGGYNR